MTRGASARHNDMRMGGRKICRNDRIDDVKFFVTKTLNTCIEASDSVADLQMPILSR